MLSFLKMAVVIKILSYIQKNLTTLYKGHLLIILFRDKPTVTKVEKKKSVVLQCAVQGNEDIEVQWFKVGNIDIGLDR